MWHLVKGKLILAIALAAVAGPAAAEPSNGQSSSVPVVLQPENEARLASQMDGQINRVPFSVGQSFREGNLLIGFSCDHQKAQLQSALANHEKAEKSLDAQTQLAEFKAASELELQLSKAELAAARADVSRARALVSDCEIRAPYDGSVVNVPVNRWENVSRGTVLMDIVGRGDLVVEALVPSNWVARISPGQEVQISVDELGITIAATIATVGARIDPVSKTTSVTARISDPPESLLPGMSGVAQFGDLLNE